MNLFIYPMTPVTLNYRPLFVTFAKNYENYASAQ